MKKIMETKPILHAVIWIIIYVAMVNVGDALTETTGMAANAITGAILIVLSMVLILYLMKNKKFKDYGLKGIMKADFQKTLFYVPLMLLALIQYTAGINNALSAREIAYAVLLMIGVGFVEELVFRGFLFQGIQAKSANRAVLISGFTFGIGHIVNLFRGYSYIEQMGQIVVAVGIGIALALLVEITESIVPGIFFHIVFNIGGTITKQDATQQVYMMIAIITISVFYSIHLYKTAFKRNAAGPWEEGVLSK